MHIGIIDQFQSIPKFHKVRLILSLFKRIPFSRQNQVKAQGNHPQTFLKVNLTVNNLNPNFSFEKNEF